MYVSIKPHEAEEIIQLTKSLPLKIAKESTKELPPQDVQPPIMLTNKP